MTSTLLIALAIVSFIVIIILLLTILNKEERKRNTLKLASEFSKIAAEKGVTVHKQESFFDRIIACDHNLSTILFVNFTIKPAQVCCIKLNNISDCRVNVNTITLTEDIKGKQKVMDQYADSIDMELAYKKQSAEQVKKICFYQFGKDHQDDIITLKKRVEWWKDLIKSNVN